MHNGNDMPPSCHEQQVHYIQYAALIVQPAGSMVMWLLAGRLSLQRHDCAQAVQFSCDY